MSKYLTILSVVTYSSVGAILTAHAGIGEDTARQMAEYYSSTVQDCGPNRPAYLCSGLMLRGTEHSSNFYVWNPSPTSIKNKGVSFSYIRKDAKYDRLGLLKYNGYAVKPSDAPSAANDIKLQVLCMFPLDAWTDNRDSSGCGDNKDTAETEQLCNLSGVDTAQKWVNQFKAFPLSKDYKKARERSCGYDVKTTLGSVAIKNFNTSLEAMGLLGDISFHRQSEIRVSTWDQNQQDKLPIFAFIYTKPVGLASARLDQNDMYTKSTNYRWIPVIKVTLPSKSSADAKFEYLPQDQMIDPSRSSACNKYFEKVEVKNVYVKEIGANRPQLSITQTECAKQMSDTEITKAMAELTAYRTDDWPLSRDKSVQAQLQCLRANYPNNSSWNIEPFRPYVNAQQMSKVRCNPYGVPDEEPEQAVQAPDSAAALAASENPEDILHRIIANYENIRTADSPCLEDKTGNPRGHYYCSGVLVRTVDYRYDPWSISPSAQTLDSTSSSWLRQDNDDVKNPRLPGPAGYILRAPSDAVAAGKEPLDVGWRCLYAYDAGTVLHGGHGCDFQYDNVKDPSKQLTLNNRNRADVYGSCAEINVRTEADWNGFMARKHYGAQCSWDPEYPKYWDSMIELRKFNRASWPYFSWNELLLKNLSSTGDGSKLIPHIDAFFYDIRRPANESGLYTARELQIRMKVASGKTLPILRLDFKASAAERFSYVASDQSPNICHQYIEKTEWNTYTDADDLQKDALYVTPTVCARKLVLSMNTIVGNKLLDMIPAELLRLSKGDPQWKQGSDEGMVVQAKCNMWMMRKAPIWLLEPLRPAKGKNWWDSANCDF
ncbi:DUF2599 domain-containing protein [Pseudomonas graminis]|uniref:DUF2599 domain-containing protein n=1 Tax=Pseudomonas graminis TaxID=158627 RepID=UPI001414F29A|nr:DUF2599 domain-containing protein [Pseudomonas graminis]